MTEMKIIDRKTANGSRLLPPGFHYLDRATAELYAKAAIDYQLCTY
jgi:hypothetical protein